MRSAVLIFLISLTAVFSLITVQAGALQNVGKDSKTILDGVYTSAQAVRGKNAFVTNCSPCHGEDLSGMSAPPLKGDPFVNGWREDSLIALFDLIRTTMPRRLDRLSEETYLDILSYILQVNTFPAGDAELKTGAIGSIQFVGKEGPQPVPDDSLIHIVGCLVQDPGGFWMLTNASEPRRTRNPQKPSAEELNASAAQSLGSGKFRLIYPDSFSPDFHIDPHKGHKMEGRGYLIRNPNDERLSVTWLEMIASACAE